MKCFLIFLCVIGVSLEAAAQNWSRTNGPVEDNVHDLCIDSNGVLYALTPLGVNCSTDGGEHWTRPFVFPVTSTSGQIMVMSNGLILVSTSSNLFILKDSAGALILHAQPNVAGRFRQFASAADGRIFGAHLTKLMYSVEDVSAWKPVIAEGDLIEN